MNELTSSSPVDLGVLFPIDANTFKNLAVNARDLHEYLGVGKDFTNWIRGRIAECGFVEGEDYVKVSNKIEPLQPWKQPGVGTGRTYSPKKASDVKPGVPEPSGYSLPANSRKIEYFCSSDMVKELGMLERNDKGRHIRRYFINAQKEYTLWLNSGNTSSEQAGLLNALQEECEALKVQLKLSETVVLEKNEALVKRTEDLVSVALALARVQ